MDKKFVILTKQTEEGSTVPSKVWITFLNNGFEQVWVPLMHWADGRMQQMVWSSEWCDEKQRLVRTNPEIKNLYTRISQENEVLLTVNKKQ